MVTIKLVDLAITNNIRFYLEYPNYRNLVQTYSKWMPTNTHTIALTSHLLENQPLEDSVCGGHPKIEAMLNDLALISLAILVL